MDNDRRKIELMNSLLLSFPGTPIVYYGDEIGMGDNIYLGDRNGVRTPIAVDAGPQWRLLPRRPGQALRPDDHGPGLWLRGGQCRGAVAQSVVAAQRHQRLISVRKSTLAFGRGSMTFIRPTNRSVLAYVRQYNDEAFSASPTSRARRRRPSSTSPPEGPHSS